jgi:hypothetical protein
MREAPPLPSEQKYDPVKAYAAHRQALLKDFPGIEASRVDAYIALCMREKGFSREVVFKTILRYTLQEQDEQTSRDWQRYAERATAYAFGVAGDVKLARSAVLREEARQAEEQDKQRQEERQPKPPPFRMR